MSALDVESPCGWMRSPALCSIDTVCCGLLSWGWSLFGAQDLKQEGSLWNACYRISVMVKVVPFSPSSGLLAWVEKTMPIGDYVRKPRDAHQRYYPGDWTSGTCALHLMPKRGEERLRAHTEVSASCDLFVCRLLRAASAAGEVEAFQSTMCNQSQARNIAS